MHTSAWEGLVSANSEPKPMCSAHEGFSGSCCPKAGIFPHPLSSREYFFSTVCWNLSQPRCYESTYQVDLRNMKCQQIRRRAEEHASPKPEFRDSH